MTNPETNANPPSPAREPSLWRIALTRALARPQLLVGLWLLSLFGALLSALPAGLSLYATLVDRPAAERLARGQADLLFAELFSTDGVASAFGPMLFAGIAVGLLLFWLLEIALSGGVVAAMLRPGHPAHAAPGRVLLRAAETAPAMLRIELLGVLILRLPLVILLAAVGFLLGHRPEIVETTASALLLRFAPLLVGFGWLWAAASVVLHYARLAQLAGGSEVSAVSALRSALQIALHSGRGLRQTLALGLLSLVGYCLLCYFGRRTASSLDVGLFVGLAFFIRQIFALWRVVLALWVTAGATEVWHDLAGPLPARTPSREL